MADINRTLRMSQMPPPAAPINATGALFTSLTRNRTPNHDITRHASPAFSLKNRTFFEGSCCARPYNGRNFKQTDLSPFAARLLGESAVATLLLSGTLKIEGSTTLQARGDGPLPLLMAEATHDRTVRGIARWTQEEAAGWCLNRLGHKGTLAITLCTPARRTLSGYRSIGKAQSCRLH